MKFPFWLTARRFFLALVPLFAASFAGGAPAPAAGDAAPQPVRREKHTPETQLRFAEGLLSRKFYEMAEAELRAFLDRYPDHELAPIAMFRLVECLRARDDVRGTVSAISQFQSRWPNHELASKLYLLKGELLFKMGETEQAVSCFKRLTISPDSVSREAALYFLAQCYARDGKTDLALETYERLSAEAFDDKHQYRPYALFAIASAHQHKGRFDEASAAFQRLITAEHVPDGIREESLYRLAENRFLREAHGEAIQLYERLLVEFPDGVFSREARKRRAWAYFASGNFDKAVELAGEWRQRYEKADDYEVNYILAAGLTAKELFGEALPLFQELARSSTVPEEYRRLSRYQEANCQLRLGNFAAAVAAAEAYAEEFPKAPSKADVLFFAGEAHVRLEDWARAGAVLRQALDAAPKDWMYRLSASLLMADCLEKQDKPKEASAVFRELAADPAREQRSALLLRAGELERQAGDAAAAIQDFERLVRDFSDSEEMTAAILHLAELYAADKTYDRAESLIQSLLEKEKDESKLAKLRFFLGYLCFQQAEYADAEGWLRQALAGPVAPAVGRDTKYYLAGTLLELGKDEEALSLFGELLLLPVAQRPAFKSDLLFRLEELYFSRNRYDVSEAICRWLLTWDAPQVVHDATLRLSQILVVQNRAADAMPMLEGLLAATEKDASAAGAARVISSHLGEVYLLTGQLDRAVSAFERSLREPEGLQMRDAARSRWGLAEILFREGRLEQALHHAVNAFVLCDEPTYTPRCMLIAIHVFLRQERTGQAVATWRELTSRYPSFAEQKKSLPELQPVLKALTAAKANGD